LEPENGPPTLEKYLATVHPEDRDFMAETIKRMHALGSGCDVKKRIVRPDGEIRYVRCVGVPVLDNGVLNGFLGTAMDVTEHELLTQELRRREAYLAEAQRLSHTGSRSQPQTVRYGKVYFQKLTNGVRLDSSWTIEEWESSNLPTMNCRIDRRFIGEDLVALYVSGEITGQHVETLRDVLQEEADALAIDLKNLSLVDREAVKLLAPL
jgi:hypothetical protein